LQKYGEFELGRLTAKISEQIIIQAKKRFILDA
jgi:hypothetical protein